MRFRPRYFWDEQRDFIEQTIPSICERGGLEIPHCGGSRRSHSCAGNCRRKRRDRTAVAQTMAWRGDGQKVAVGGRTHLVGREGQRAVHPGLRITFTARLLTSLSNGSGRYREPGTNRARGRAGSEHVVAFVQHGMAFPQQDTKCIAKSVGNCGREDREFRKSRPINCFRQLQSHRRHSGAAT